MKKLFIGTAMVLVLGLVANIAFTDESVPFPFWQHGWAIMSFWSVTNAAPARSSAIVTINMLRTDGTLHFSTTGVVDGGTAWQLSTDQADQGGQRGWFTAGNGAGFGRYDIVSDTDTVYLWGAVFANLGNMQPGYTIVMPGNPYGIPGM
jgi:hypothetical protein